MLFSTISFHLELDSCLSSTTSSATIVLEYRTGQNAFIIMQIFIESGKRIVVLFYAVTLTTIILGNQIVTLPLAAQTTDVQLKWRALLSADWSIDNIRIGSDTFLYYLGFDIQVGNCLPPPINGSVSSFVSLEYYDGSYWSLLQQECLHSKCFQKVSIKVPNCSTV